MPSVTHAGRLPELVTIGPLPVPAPPSTCAEAPAAARSWCTWASRLCCLDAPAESLLLVEAPEPAVREWASSPPRLRTAAAEAVAGAPLTPRRRPPPPLPRPPRPGDRPP